MAEETNAEVAVPEVTEVKSEVAIEKDELTLIREQLAKTEQERDNYKNVALKRKGKLPNDNQFFNEEGEELTVAEQVRLALLDREVEIKQQQEKEATEKLLRENAELRLALKNQPSTTIGGSGSGDTTTVKDNVFSEAQLIALKARAERIGADPVAFINQAKLNLQKRS